MAIPSWSKMVPISCGWIGSSTNDSTPVFSRAVPIRRTPGTAETASVAHVYLHARRRLRPVHQHGNALLVRQCNHTLHRRDRAQRVRHVPNGDELGFWAEQLFVFLDQELAAIVDRHYPQPRALLFAKH